MYSVGMDVDTFLSCLQNITCLKAASDWEKILLFAGNFSLSNPLLFIRLGKIYLKSSIPLFIKNNKLNKKARVIEQSAGNFNLSTKASARTKNTYNSYFTLPKISEHVPKHKSNLNDLDFGYFLAGLIEGDGWFGFNQLHIIFSDRDISLAYLIKKRIGHGNVYKIKDKKAVRYICKNYNGLKTILYLINGKLLSSKKYEQLIVHNYPETFHLDILPPTHNLSLDNYWLAGFTQADGCFYISVVKSKSHKTGFSVRLEFSIKQNDDIPLKLLISKLKLGNLCQYHTGIYCYKSSGYKTAAVLINYFDLFHVFGGKYVDYLKFRKVYIKISEGKHLEKEGIIKIKSITNKGSSETRTQEI